MARPRPVEGKSTQLKPLLVLVLLLPIRSIRRP